MSSQRGNTTRSRPQKHKNKTAFKNNLHDTSHRTKLINNIHVYEVCERCKEIIEWKIKYKKYKPLTQPKKCVKCEQRTVKKAYHVMCTECGKKLAVCTKCCQNKEIVQALDETEEQLKLDNEMKNLLQSLPERKRRTFLRYLDKKSKEPASEDNPEDQRKNDLLEKLNSLKVCDDDNINNIDDEESSDIEDSDD